MNKVQERFWIPQLRHITRRLRLSCNHCKKFRAGALSAPPMAALPSFRAEFTDPFSSTGVDFIGPLYHKTQGINPGKAYVVLHMVDNEVESVHGGNDDQDDSRHLQSDNESMKRFIHEAVLEQTNSDVLVDDYRTE